MKATAAGGRHAADEKSTERLFHAVISCTNMKTATGTVLSRGLVVAYLVHHGCMGWHSRHTKTDEESSNKI